ncbi:MAG: class I SAM-dependent methyltransferase [Halobacteria archaeon]|nr:class I SAM-dependent methyltransferase [Halobacteria archaeon]
MATNSWDADLYDGDHLFVSEYGEDLMDLLSVSGGERVLDLGCGTGHLTKQIETEAKNVEVTGLDSSKEMLEKARETYPGIDFIDADARDFEASGYDAVFSNAALHWVEEGEQEEVLESVRNGLKEGGRFVAETGGDRNADKVISAVIEVLSERGHEVTNPWYFPTVGEYATLLEDNGFEVREMRLFDRPTRLEGGEDGLRNWIEMFGDSFFPGVPDDERRRVVSEVESLLRDDLFHEGTESWIADYRRLRFVAYRR